MSRPHYQKTADARFDRDHLTRMSEDHMNIAHETENLRHAAMAGIVGVCTVVLIGLMLLFVSYGGPMVIKKIANQIEQVQQ